jgi:hypothetical protein
MWWPIWWALAALNAAPAPAVQAPRTPEQLVRQFFALAATDSAAAARLVGPGAIMGAGDIGAPLSLEWVPTRIGCIPRRTAAKTRTIDDDGKRASIVETDWLCRVKGTNRGAPVRARVIVDGDLIMGIYMAGSEKTVAWPQPGRY